MYEIGQGAAETAVTVKTDYSILAFGGIRRYVWFDSYIDLYIVHGVV